MTARDSLNEGAGKPRRVTVAIDVDTSAFRAALDELRRSVGTVGEAFAGMPPAFREVASALTALARELAHGEQVRRAAVERYGITEIDIRRVEGSTVITWNRRRIEVIL